MSNSRVKPANHGQLKKLRQAYISLFNKSFLMDDCNPTTYEPVIEACKEVAIAGEGIQDVFKKALLVDIEHPGKNAGLEYVQISSFFNKD